MVVVAGNVSHVLRSRHFSFLLTITRASQFFRCETRFFVYRIFNENNFKDEGPVTAANNAICSLWENLMFCYERKNISRAIFGGWTYRAMFEMFTILRELRSPPRRAREILPVIANTDSRQLFVLYAALHSGFDESVSRSLDAIIADLGAIPARKRRHLIEIPPRNGSCNIRSIGSEKKETSRRFMRREHKEDDV